MHTLRTHDQTSVCKCVRACVRTCVVHCCFKLHQVARSWKHLQSAKPPEPPGHAKPKLRLSNLSPLMTTKNQLC